MYQSRRQTVAAESSGRPDSGIVISNLSDVRWLTGFTGSNACVGLFSDTALLFTDSRYLEQVKTECEGIQTRIETGSLVTRAAAWIAERGASAILCQKDHIGASLFQTLRSEHTALAVELFEDSCKKLRASKTEQEIETIKRALSISEAVFSELPDLIREGMTERELAAEIDYRQRIKGADASAFDTIVAFGEHSALPHARPGIKTLAGGMPVLVDFGCVVDGYSSDMTRMLHFGPPSEPFSSAYSNVEISLQASTEAARSGMTGRQLDAVARENLDNNGKGLARYFTHSLGHGVGLDIHEWPTISSRGAAPLVDSCVVTLEPGVYIAGSFGVRIENMVVLRNNGAETLNTSSTELIVL